MKDVLHKFWVPDLQAFQESGNQYMVVESEESVGILFLAASS